MPRIKKFFHNLYESFFSFYFKKIKISKKMYRNAALLYSGAVVVSVLSFSSTTFSASGKNTAFAYTNTESSTDFASHNEDGVNSEEDLSLTVNLSSHEILVENQQFQEELIANFTNEAKNLLANEVIKEVQNKQRKKEILISEAKKNREELIEYKNELEKEHTKERLITQVKKRFNIQNFNENDYENLLKIVEAEVGNNDLKGRIIVANVILNRVKHKKFPNSITQVIFQPRQFSPIRDKRFYKVKVSKLTKEAVNKALLGEDYSNGALYFMSRKSANSRFASWFDSSLKYLFSYGGHEYFTYK